MGRPSSELIREFVLYLRKSVGRAGIARQRRDSQRYADQHGIRIVGEYVDADRTAYSKVGGRRAERDDYDRMLATLRADRREVPLGVLSWHADRLHRDVAEGEVFIEVAAAGRHMVETARSGTYELWTPTGRKRFRQDIIDAAYEVDHMIERIEAAKVEAASEGRWLGGRRPFGYEADGVTVRAEEAALIAQATDDLLVGVSLGQIARDWNAAGVTTSGGKQWRMEEVRRTLLRARNAGIMVHRGEEVGAAVWPAIVSEERWRAVVALCADPSRRTTPGPTRRWLGSGLYVCGFPVEEQECGQKLRMGSTSSKPTYRCNSMTRHVVRDARHVDAYVRKAVVAWLSQPLAAEVLAPPKRDDDAMALHMEAATIKARIAEAGDMWEAGELSRAEYVARKGRLQERLDRLNERIAASVTVTELDGLFGVDDVGAAWDELPLSRRRSVLDRLVIVTILPAPRGRPPGWSPGDPYFSPEHVRLEWKYRA